YSLIRSLQMPIALSSGTCRPVPIPLETAMTTAAPFVSSVLGIEKDWIDYNGHLNMAYYNVLFDRCSDEAFAVLGMGPKYAEERRLTTYTAEIHVCYVRELHLGDKVTSTF